MGEYQSCHDPRKEADSPNTAAWPGQTLWESKVLPLITLYNNRGLEDTGRNKKTQNLVGKSKIY